MSLRVWQGSHGGFALILVAESYNYPGDKAQGPNVETNENIRAPISTTTETATFVM